MPTTLNNESWKKLIDEDIAWLLRMPRTLERDHIHQCMLTYRRLTPSQVDQLCKQSRQNKEPTP